jgi:uncharacterized protein (DUF1684 family)
VLKETAMSPARWHWLVLLAALPGCSAPPPAPDTAYVEEIESWRAEREARLRSENGWLTLVGLHWLEPGENLFGSAPDNPVALPPGTAPGHAGTFTFASETVTVRAAAGVEILLDGEPVTQRQLRSDADGEPDILRLGDLRLHVIKRGERFAIRVKDPSSEVRLGFTGLEHFPVDPSYRLEAEFVAYDELRERQIPTAVGTMQPMLAPGYVRFTLAGQELSLEPLIDHPDDEELFFIFRDGTSGVETYGAGRFLYAARPVVGRIVLDFNKAYNPPCVFTPYATCPLPPPQNLLAPRVEAGEKTYGRH